jgi:hypothetical protein
MPYEIGDTEPPHIDVHNALNAEVAELSTRSGIEVVLPPIVSLGDTGHVSDHNLYTTAIQKIADGIGPSLSPAPIVTPPTSTGKPGVTSAYVRNKQGDRLVAYVLPGDVGEAQSLALTEEGQAAVQLRREALEAIANTPVPDDFSGDPVTLLPKKLRTELRGFVELRASSKPPSEFTVTLGAGSLPGIMVAAGGYGSANSFAGAGAGGVIGQGAHQNVILPVTTNATYTLTVASTSIYDLSTRIQGQPTTISTAGQTEFATAVGGGAGFDAYGDQSRRASPGGSGGGGESPMVGTQYNLSSAAEGVPGQGHAGNYQPNKYGGGGGYGSGNESTANGGAGFDLATALNLDANDSQTAALLSQVTVEGYIAGGGAGQNGTATAGGALPGLDGKDYTGGGGSGQFGSGGAGMVLLLGPA